MQLNIAPYITLQMIKIYFSVKKTLKKFNKYINRDLQLTIDWRRSNKLSLKISKTELVLFKLKRKR